MKEKIEKAAALVVCTLIFELINFCFSLWKNQAGDAVHSALVFAALFTAAAYLVKADELAGEPISEID